MPLLYMTWHDIRYITCFSSCLVQNLILKLKRDSLVQIWTIATKLTQWTKRGFKNLTYSDDLLKRRFFLQKIDVDIQRKLGDWSNNSLLFTVYFFSKLCFTPLITFYPLSNINPLIKTLFMIVSTNPRTKIIY